MCQLVVHQNPFERKKKCLAKKNHSFPSNHSETHSSFFSRKFQATCTRTPVFSKMELFDPGYIETVTCIRTYPNSKLFENARPRDPKRSFSKTPPKWTFRKRRFRIRIFFEFEHSIRIFSATVSKAIKNGLPKRWILLHVHLQSRCRNR